MKRSTLTMMLLSLSMLLLIAAAASFASPPQSTQSPAMMYFGSVDIFIDTGSHDMAAYQLELSADDSNTIHIVGIEGATLAPFAQPPYYDPAAMQHDRVTLAAFSTLPAHDLPTGRFRIATVHYQADTSARPTWNVKLTAVADHDGRSIAASISLSNPPIPEGSTP